MPWFTSRLELICWKKLASPVNFFLVTWVNLNFCLLQLAIYIYMSSSLFKSENGWKSLVQIMQNQCNVNFYLFVEACRFVYWFCHNFYAPMCHIYRTEYYRMIFRYTYRFATDFTGKINNHILKGRGNGGYSSRQARPTHYISKGKTVS